MYAGQIAARTNSGKSRQPGSPGQSHQYGFGLIIGMMGSGQRRKAARSAPGGKRRIACSASGCLEAGFGRYVDPQDAVGDAQPGTGPLDELGFGDRFRPQPMVDRRRLDPAGAGSSGEVQHRHAVGPTRDG